MKLAFFNGGRMSKLDKIGYFVKDSGEEISKDVYDYIVKEEQKKRYKELQEKFREDKIKKDELVELMKLMRKTTDVNLLYDSFYKVNLSKPKPVSISKSEYGDFFQLLNFLSYSNTITHRNGKALKYTDMAEYLGFKTVKSLKNYIRKMKKTKMLATVELGGIEYLIINPAYAQRKMKLNYTVFKLFEEDLIEFLDVYQIKLLELDEDDFEISTINPITD